MISTTVKILALCDGGDWGANHHIFVCGPESGTCGRFVFSGCSRLEQSCSDRFLGFVDVEVLSIDGCFVFL